MEAGKPVGFSTGREFYKETGLYYYRARYYDPIEGRFISKDPFKGGDVNLYGYVKNNSINYKDLDGTLVGAAAGAAVAIGTVLRMACKKSRLSRICRI
jgi:RHS repeat-associated protein